MQVYVHSARWLISYLSMLMEQWAPQKQLSIPWTTGHRFECKNVCHDRSKRHPSFIPTRLGEILDVTDSTQWNHFPGKINPADDGTRGLPTTAINRESRSVAKWAVFSPPRPEEQWPKENLKPDSTSCSVDSPQAEEVPWTNSEFTGFVKYSSLTKLLHVTAYLIRFFNNCRCPKSERLTGLLLVRELEHSKKTLIRLVQAETFPTEVWAQRNNQQVREKSKLVAFSYLLFSTKMDLSALADVLRKLMSHSVLATQLSWHQIMNSLVWLSWTATRSLGVKALVMSEMYWDKSIGYCAVEQRYACFYACFYSLKRLSFNFDNHISVALHLVRKLTIVSYSNPLWK